MKKTLLFTTLLFSLGMISCDDQKEAVSETTPTISEEKSTQKELNTFLSIFEIPALDISRAIDFYEAILDLNIEKMEIPGMEMGIFPYEDQVITGVIIKGEGYQPSANGVTIYLNGGDNLQIILDKVEKNGGKISVPKTPHGDESGYFALFFDSEGNKIGLHSPN